MYLRRLKPEPAAPQTTRGSWDDLTQPLAVLTELQDLGARLSAAQDRTTTSRYGPNPWATSQYLFCGSSGIGKILAARLIARDLDLIMWKLSSASLVGRYIGETETNLDRVFDRSKNTGWILFFDEADALFGKRTGMRTHNSRYANQEISYLLARAEHYRGVVIVSTQAKPNFRARLMRRFESVIKFS